MAAPPYWDVLIRFLSGGNYLHDLTEVFFDGVFISSHYEDLSDDEGDIGEPPFVNEIAQGLAEGKIVQLRGYRADQAKRPTESLTIYSPTSWEGNDYFNLYTWDDVHGWTTNN